MLFLEPNLLNHKTLDEAFHFWNSELCLQFLCRPRPAEFGNHTKDRDFLYTHLTDIPCYVKLKHSFLKNIMWLQIPKESFFKQDFIFALLLLL